MTPHRCQDHLDYISGSDPYECRFCGKRRYAADLHDPDARRADLPPPP
jgi:hypothetical protein